MTAHIISKKEMIKDITYPLLILASKKLNITRSVKKVIRKAKTKINELESLRRMKSGIVKRA